MVRIGLELSIEDQLANHSLIVLSSALESRYNKGVRPINQ